MKNKSIWILIISFCFVFCGYDYIHNNLGEIFGVRAEYYFKRNNIEKALEFYEKAFELGLKSSQKREAYVNMLINMPMTIVTQEKLLAFVKNPIEDVAFIKAKYFFNDIKREIYRKYPENFIVNTVYNQKVMRWGNSPITYSFVVNDNVPKYFVTEIENALTEWEKATDSVILFEENDRNPNIVIKFNNEQSLGKDDNQKFVVAYTSPMVNFNSLMTMEINFYLKDPTGKYFSKNQIYNTALHEIAHSLGFMGHSDNKNDVMYLTKDSISESNDIRENLSNADINTIKLLYQIKPQISNIDNPKGDYIPYIVLGSKTEINNEKLEEARLYIKKASNLPAGYIDLAEAYVAIKDYQKAIKNLNIALKLADNEEIKSMIYFNLAVVYFYTDLLDESQKYLNQSMNYNKTPEKYYLQGEIFVREGRLEDAIKIYSNLIAKTPDNIEYVIALTNIHILNHDYLKARSILKDFFKRNPMQKGNSRFAPYGILKFGL